MATRPIVALDPAHRHAHTPAVLAPNHQFYEWWYFEVDFEDERGKPWRVITSFHYPHALDPRRVLAHQRYQPNDGTNFHARYGDDPAQYAGVASYVVDAERRKNVALLISRFQPWSIPSKVKLSRPGDPKVDLEFGRSSFKENLDGTYTLTVRHSGVFWRPGVANRLLTIDLKAKFEQNTPGFQVPDTVLIDQTGVKHHWACVMPSPRITVEHCEVKRANRNRGFTTLCRVEPGKSKAISGYHDHQWGDDLFYKQIEDWSWGRVATAARGAALPRDKVLFFDVRGVGMPTVPAVHPDPVVVEVPGDGSSWVRLDPTPGTKTLTLSGPDRVDFGDGCQLGIQGQRVPYFQQLKLRGQMPSGESRNFNVAHSMRNNVDVWPFYVRFMPDVVDFHTGKTLPAISEYMRAGRLTAPDAQRILAMSDRMTYLE
jgi:hypothetical protein